MKKDVVRIIRSNPNCFVEIDNDWWGLWTSKESRDNDDDPLVDSSDDIIGLGHGYGSGNCYGGDILQALAKIVGITVVSV